jgi:hypothetical protein
METLEVNPASGRARPWGRLLDPDKPPRSWWFPPSSRRDDVPRMPEAVQPDYRKVLEQTYEKFSETIRLAMLSLLGFALFCLLITFSTSDSTLLVADPTIKMPFADVQVSFQSFLLLAPSLLIVITLYLHIFYGYWLDRKTDYKHFIRVSGGVPSIEHLPTLFSLEHPVPRFLTNFIFYWIVSLVLGTITWKAAARLVWGLPLGLITILVTTILIFLQIRRCPTSQRKWNRLLWGVMVLIAGVMVGYMVGIIKPQGFERPLNIFRADLKEKWLAGVNLRRAKANLANFEGANLQIADLQGADLQGAFLEGAFLEGADLQGANLRRAKLRDANLQDASLQRVLLEGADLRRAKLQGAKLWIASLQGANLQGAKLQSAILQGADLQFAFLWHADLRRADLQGAKLQGSFLRAANFQEVKHLTEEQIRSTDTDERTLLPDYFKTPVP